MVTKQDPAIIKTKVGDYTYVLLRPEQAVVK
jgi:hypothetical protein